MQSSRVARLFVLCVPLAAPSLLSTGASAQMTWRVQNELSESLAVVFFSQNRNHQWPEAGKVMVLDDKRTYRYTIACNPGELVCLGAWSKTSNRVWGVGYNNRRKCEDCCYHCLTNITPKQVLK